MTPVRSVLIVLLLLASWTQAAGGTLATGTARSLETEGPTNLTGGLLALSTTFKVRGPDALVDLSLTAQRLVVQQAHNYRNASAASIGLSEYSSSEERYGPAQVATAEGRTGSYFFVAALDPANPPSFESASDGALAVASSESTMESESFIAANEFGLQVPTQHAIRADARGALAPLTVRGDFVVTLWEWDVDVTADGSQHHYPSGRDSVEHVPFPLDVRGIESSHMRQTYITAHDGVLDVLLRPQVFALHGTELGIATQGLMRIRDMSGSVPAASTHLENGRLDMRGELSAVLQPSQDGLLLASVRGHVDSLNADGQPLTVTTARRDPTGVWVVAAAVVVATAAWLLVRRRLQLSRAMRSLEAEMERGAYAEVAKRGSALVRTRRHGRDAVVMHAVALLRLGRYDEAAATLMAVRRWRGEDLGVKEYLLANVYAARGDRAAAREAIKRCLAVAPTMRLEILHNPRLAPLLAKNPTEGYS